MSDCEEDVEALREAALATRRRFNQPSASADDAKDAMEAQVEKVVTAEPEGGLPVDAKVDAEDADSTASPSAVPPDRSSPTNARPSVGPRRKSHKRARNSGNATDNTYNFFTRQVPYQLPLLHPSLHGNSILNFSLPARLATGPPSHDNIANRLRQRFVSPHHHLPAARLVVPNAILPVSPSLLLGAMRPLLRPFVPVVAATHWVCAPPLNGSVPLTHRIANDPFDNAISMTQRFQSPSVPFTSDMHRLRPPSDRSTTSFSFSPSGQARSSPSDQRSPIPHPGNPLMGSPIVLDRMPPPQRRPHPASTMNHAASASYLAAHSQFPVGSGTFSDGMEIPDGDGYHSPPPSTAIPPTLNIPVDLPSITRTPLRSKSPPRDLLTHCRDLGGRDRRLGKAASPEDDSLDPSRGNDAALTFSTRRRSRSSDRTSSSSRSGSNSEVGRCCCGRISTLRSSKRRRQRRPSSRKTDRTSRSPTAKSIYRNASPARESSDYGDCSIDNHDDDDDDDGNDNDDRDHASPSPLAHDQTVDAIPSLKFSTCVDDKSSRKSSHDSGKSRQGSLTKRTTLPAAESLPSVPPHSAKSGVSGPIAPEKRRESTADDHDEEEELLDYSECDDDEQQLLQSIDKNRDDTHDQSGNDGNATHVHEWLETQNFEDYLSLDKSVEDVTYDTSNLADTSDGASKENLRVDGERRNSAEDSAGEKAKIKEPTVVRASATLERRSRDRFQRPETPRRRSPRIASNDDDDDDDGDKGGSKIGRKNVRYRRRKDQRNPGRDDRRDFRRDDRRNSNYRRNTQRQNSRRRDSSYGRAARRDDRRRFGGNGRRDLRRYGPEAERDDSNTRRENRNGSRRSDERASAREYRRRPITVNKLISDDDLMDRLSKPTRHGKDRDDGNFDNGAAADGSRVEKREVDAKRKDKNGDAGSARPIRPENREKVDSPPVGERECSSDRKLPSERAVTSADINSATRSSDQNGNYIVVGAASQAAERPKENPESSTARKRPEKDPAAERLRPSTSSGYFSSRSSKSSRSGSSRSGDTCDDGETEELEKKIAEKRAQLAALKQECSA